MQLNVMPPPSSSSPFRLSPSSLRLFQTCPRKFELRYCYGIEGRREPSDKLRFGTAVHKALELNVNKPVADWRVREAAAGLDADLGALVAGTAAAYAVHWDGTLRYSAAELKLETELRNPRLTYLTILDGVAENQAGDQAVVEHKTTESDIRPGSYYWEKTVLDIQASSYLWAARVAGYPVAHVEWDAIKRPNLKRRTEGVPPEYYVKSGKWGAAGDLKPGTGLPVESPAEFAGRVRSTMLADPTGFFQRSQVVRLDDEIDAAVRDIDIVGEQILHAWDHTAFPKNPSSCFAFGEKCEYFDVCTGAAQPTDETLYQIRKSRQEPA